MASEGGHEPKHHRDEKPGATTDNQRKKHGQDGPARVRFMRAGEPDALGNDTPDSGNETAAKRKDEKWIDLSSDEAVDAKCRFEGFLCPTNQHQTKMNDGRADKDAHRKEKGN
jgi:hypothetical protein